MEQADLVTVYESQGILGAQVVKSKLESAGIPALLRYESVGQVFGLTVDGLGRVEVQVPETWVAEALRWLSDDGPEDESGAGTFAEPGADEEGE